MAPDELFTREEVLGGLPARRARTLLFLIERQTAHWVSESEQLTELLSREEAPQERDVAFLQAFALGREPPVRLRIQDIERYAPRWAHLVPENPHVRAVVSRLLCQKYTFTARAVPSIRAALGLDQNLVQRAYQQLYGQPLETMYAPRIALTDELRWAWAALSSVLDVLPPFWFACVFTLALGIPQAIVALPIAVAAVGPLPGIALTLAAGLVSLVTMACVAEAAARSGIVRYGTAYIGKLTVEYLGPAGSGLFTLAVFLLYLVTVMGGFFAISRTLAQFTHVSALVWTLLLFAAGMYLLARGSVSLSVTLLVMIAGIIMSLMLAIMVLTAGHVQVEHLTRLGAPLLQGRLSGLDNSIGVILMGYFGEAFVVQCAKVVLPRDPSGRSLIWGSLAGLAGIAAFLVVWILIINGSLASEMLVGQTVTVATPLAAVFGPAIAALGFFLVLFLPGLAMLRCMISVFNVVREWLPVRSRPIVILPRLRGKLLLFPRGRPGASPMIGLTYLGLDGGQPHLRMDFQLGDNTRHVEMAIAGHWDAAALLDRFPDLRKHDVRLTLDVLDATPQSVRLQVTSPFALTYEGDWDMETPATAPRPASASAATQPAWERVLGDRGRFLLSVSPIALIFLLAEWLLWAGRDSFPSVLGILGVINSSIFSGVIPVLLLVSSRRKGDVVPGVVLKFLGHPLLIGGVYLLYIAVLLLHGLVIWETPAARAAALLTTVVALAATAAMARWGAFTPRVVLELREDLRQGGQSAFAIVAKGQQAAADVRLVYLDDEQPFRASTGAIPRFSALRSATFELPRTHSGELKVWVHRVTPEGNSEGLPAVVEVQAGNEAKRFDLRLSKGQVILPFNGAAAQVKITFPQPSIA